MSDASPDYGERSRRFNETTGVYGYVSVSGIRGGNHHPDRCVCQGNPFPGDGRGDRDFLGHGRHGPLGDTTPHKHYPEPPYRCARCSKCDGYVPHDEAAKLTLMQDARAIVTAAQMGHR